MLRDAVDDFARTLAVGFQGERSTDTEEILRAYARDHG
jgi:hypothetical protein